VKTFHDAAQVTTGSRKTCVAIGFFDGVHLGHQQIIRQSVQDARQHDARAVVVTFDRHPNTIVAPDRVPPLIHSLPQRTRAIEALDVDILLMLHFDEALCRTSGETFIRNLARDLAPIHSICVGSNFVFGHQRDGNVELLKRLGAELRFSVHGLAAVALNSKVVSSTRIRSAIRTGDLDGISQMLGRAYSIAGIVVRGDGLGRKLGFPTANVDVAGLALPPRGVYAIRARVNTADYRAVLNIGSRPTVDPGGTRVQVEAHLLDFQGDLYGCEIELGFVQRLREEKTFASSADLRDQIARDIQRARRLF
jgi:riboflavin kinase/FMN adenylyltransferase